MPEKEKLPESWYSQIEKSKEKARKLLKKVVAIDLSDAILVGKLDDITLDKLFKSNYPFCKLTLTKAKKYSIDGKLTKQIDDEQICFVNKPQMILDMDELAKRFPEIHADVHVDIKRERFD